jgi:hypothetical protein
MALYERQQDSRYVDMKNFGAKWGISDQEIEQVYQLIRQHENAMQDYQRRLNLVEAADTPKQNELKSAMEQVSANTTQYLANLLGPDRFDTLKRNGILPSGK